MCVEVFVVSVARMQNGIFLHLMSEASLNGSAVYIHYEIFILFLNGWMPVLFFCYCVLHCKESRFIVCFVSRQKILPAIIWF